jgi:tellurite resistance protein TehA-like permease
MPATEMIVTMGVGLFFLLGFIFILRLIQAWMIHKTLRDAIGKDSAHVGILVDRTGLILLALGAATAGFSLIVGDLEWLRYGLGAALFPTLVGAALLVRDRMQRRSAGPDDAAAA